MKSWGVYILAALGFVAYGVMTDADRDSSGAIVDGGSLDAFQIRVGDCFDDSSQTEGGISSVPGVPCSEPHDNEAYAVFDVSITEYPATEDEMYELSFDACMGHFEAFVGRDYDTSSLDITTMYPSVESWKQDDREVICAVYDMETNKLTGSAKGLGL